MKVVLSAKLKLTHTPEQKQALDRVTLAYRDALNFTSQVAFDNGKISQQVKLQKLVYADIRERYGLPAQMACNVPRQVGASYKSLWTKVKQNKAAQENGHTKKRYKGLDKAPKYVSRTLTYNYGRDYGFKNDQHVSVNTLEGRLVLPYEGYDKHLDAIANGAKVGAAKLYYQKTRKQYYLIVALEIDVADPKPHPNIVGVDVGQRYHAVATNQIDDTFFAPGGETNHRKERYTRVRQQLQRKDTRSAKRRLAAISGRERRFIADRNHSLSKSILTRYPNSLIGLEDLTGIRTHTEFRSKKDASPKMKRSKRRRSQWSFAELQSMIAYKAPLHGSMTTQVHSQYTSQCCSKCGHCSKGNRPNKGLMFVCEICRFECHADLVASRNIALRTLLVRQDWMSTGVLSARPDVSHDEAKARYLDLRWSVDTSQDQPR